MEFKEAHLKQQKEPIRTVMVERKEAWKTPELGVVKLNVSSETSGKWTGSGVGIVARNHEGKLLQTWSVFQ